MRTDFYYDYGLEQYDYHQLALRNQIGLKHSTCDEMIQIFSRELAHDEALLHRETQVALLKHDPDCKGVPVTPINIECAICGIEYSKPKKEAYRIMREHLKQEHDLG